DCVQQSAEEPEGEGNRARSLHGDSRAARERALPVAVARHFQSERRWFRWRRLSGGTSGWRRRRGGWWGDATGRWRGAGGGWAAVEEAAGVVEEVVVAAAAAVCSAALGRRQPI